MMEIPHEHFGFKNQMQPVKIITATAINSQQVERKAEHLQDEIQKQRLEIQHEKQEQEVHQREEQRRLVQVKAQQEKERLKQEVLKMAALEKQRKLLEKLGSNVTSHFLRLWIPTSRNLLTSWSKKILKGTFLTYSKASC